MLKLYIQYPEPYPNLDHGYRFPWTLLTWALKSALVLNVRLHESHSNSFGFSWTLKLWYFNPTLLRNFNWQILHSNFFSWATFMWSRHRDLLPNVFAHKVHSSFLWLDRWVFKWNFVANISAQNRHLLPSSSFDVVQQESDVSRLHCKTKNVAVGYFPRLEVFLRHPDL